MSRMEKAGFRKQKIIEATVVCILEKGYHQAGMRDIAEAAGVSLGNLYNHFPGKQAILMELAAIEGAELEPFIALLDAAKRPQDSLSAFANAYLDYMAAPENALLTLELTAESFREPQIAAIFQANRSRLIAALGSTLGLETPNRDLYAEMVLDLIEGTALRAVAERRRPDAAARKALHQMLAGAAKRPA
ncbi:TetR/AcrR family transcriptional regulator [Pelagibacterium flavum]|uniref:TetR/AcrR family transcriptional regulator n=1 Tax=Pelagibacterium flavum TaxID=2984530 RepID=A0ABY6IST9_9HYPH|nr:TetR/AcrR family transcriptional regulator [Pelagibacterium sp. YIM 151497]UYQ73697.1 TetR/AcrR family transcriptional regulator [Pelagibacterium sp. YIM 151497]